MNSAINGNTIVAIFTKSSFTSAYSIFKIYDTQGAQSLQIDPLIVERGYLRLAFRHDL